MPTHTNTSVLVTGGTGTIGQLVVPRLLQAGCAVRVLSRGRRPVQQQRQADSGSVVEYVTGDVGTGDGVSDAVADMEVVLHLAGGVKGDDDKARHVARAASRARVRHLVFLSVVGADRIPVISGVDRAMFGYYAAKRTAEQIIAESGVPWTTVRATQLHEFIVQVGEQLAKLPIVMSWAGVRFQPVDGAEVADHLVDLSLGGPAGLVPDLGGPKIHDMDTLMRDHLRARGQHRLVMPVRMPGRAARAMRDGANLTPGRLVGERTWEDFLAANARAGQPERPASRQPQV